MTNRTPLDDVEFLARSAHRVEVLQTLTSGARTRPELRDETGISQPTLGRVLGSLQERNWVEQNGREYVLTAFGELVAEEFSDLLDTVETVQRLGEIISLLPTEQMDFDVRLFGDATVTTPTTGDVFRHIRRVETLVYDADHLRLLSTTVAPGSPEEHLERVEKFLAGDQVVESVLTVNTLDQSTSVPEIAEIFADILLFERVQLYLYEGTIPQMVGVSDGTAFLVPFDGQGIPAAVIETTNPTIRSWAETTIDEYISKSTKLTADSLPH
ncbi:helix-turn-helix transcriptional regulator [Haloferax sp. YSMS24]|uniref:helix-turn-helix transcriptional regulator n=1 Tax=unclassified Haloferax TaxID=2625095 RepID=UPI00398CC525